MNMSMLRAGIICISTIVSFASTQVMSMDLTKTKKRGTKQTSEQPAKKRKTSNNPVQQKVDQEPRITIHPQSPILESGSTQQPKTYVFGGNYYAEQTYSGQEYIDNLNRTNKVLEEQARRYQQQPSTSQMSQQQWNPLAVGPQQPRQPQIATVVHEIDPAADRRLFERYSNYAAEQQKLNSSQNR